MKLFFEKFTCLIYQVIIHILFYCILLFSTALHQKHDNVYYIERKHALFNFMLPILISGSTKDEFALVYPS